MAVHPDCQTPAFMVYWLRNECTEATHFEFISQMWEQFYAWLELCDAKDIWACTSIARNKVTGEEWRNAPWMRELVGRLWTQWPSQYNGPAFSRDVVLDTLLDIAYPVEVRCHYAQAFS